MLKPILPEFGIEIGELWMLSRPYHTSKSLRIFIGVRELKHPWSRSVVEPLAIFGMAYLSYTCAEVFHFSGIVSIIGCGLVQAHYAFKNISKKSYTTVKYFTKTIRSWSLTFSLPFSFGYMGDVKFFQTLCSFGSNRYQSLEGLWIEFNTEITQAHLKTCVSIFLICKSVFIFQAINSPLVNVNSRMFL